MQKSWMPGDIPLGVMLALAAGCTLALLAGGYSAATDLNFWQSTITVVAWLIVLGFVMFIILRLFDSKRT